MMGTEEAIEVVVIEDLGGPGAQEIDEEAAVEMVIEAIEELGEEIRKSAEPGLPGSLEKSERKKIVRSEKSDEWIGKRNGWRRCERSRKQ